MEEIENYKREICAFCDNFHSCTDLEGDLLDEQIKICMTDMQAND